MNRLYVATLLLSSVAFAQNSSDDPGGWTKAKWGMTQDQIRTAFPETAQIDDGTGRLSLGLRSYPIEQRKFAVVFSFDNEKRLNSVRLEFQKILIGRNGSELSLVCDKCDAFVKAAMNERAVTDGKDFILHTLTDKYGNPTTHRVESDGRMEYFDWLFPSTKISLFWFHSQFKELDSVSVSFALHAKSSDL
jgi:hypothetical protein